MSRKRLVTPAVRTLREAGVDYAEHHYRYTAKSGAAGGAAELGIDPHRVIKTLIVAASDGSPKCVLMHGDREVSLKQLAREIGVKSVTMADPADAKRHTGYRVGGTSPFGMLHAMPVYCESSIAYLETIVINGGKRGFLIEIATADLLRVLDPQLVAVATSRASD